MTDAATRYLDLLGDLDPIEVLQATPVRLSEAFEELTQADLAASHGATSGTRAELIARLADVELLMGFRFRQLAAVPGVELQQPDLDAWSARYGQLEPSLAVEAFRALRAWNLALLATFGLDDWLAEGYHPERGFESMDQLVRMLAGHDLELLACLRS